MKRLFLSALAMTFSFSLAMPALALETVDGAKKDYQAAKAEVAAQLESLDKKIDELKASTRQKSTAAKEKALKEAQDLREKLGADYEKMKEATDSNWTRFKNKVADSLDRLNTKAQKALKE